MAILPDAPRTTTITLAAATAGPFDVGFRLFGREDLIVYVGMEERTDWTLEAFFTNGYSDDGQIRFTAPLPAGSILTIDAVLKIERPTNYVPTDPSLTKKLNQELGRIWSALAETRRDVDRSLRTYGAQEPLKLPPDLQRGYLAFDGSDLVVAEGVPSDTPGTTGFATRSAFLADTSAVADGMVTHAEGYAYRRYSPAALDGMKAGWVPGGQRVSPRHFGAVGDGVTDDFLAVQRASNYVEANPGLILSLDAEFAISRGLNLRARWIEGAGRILLRSDFQLQVAGSWSLYGVRLGANSQANGGRGETVLHVDGSAFFGTAVGSWSPASGAFPVSPDPSKAIVGESWYVSAAGNFAGLNYYPGDLLVALVVNPGEGFPTTFNARWKRISPRDGHANSNVTPYTAWNPKSGTYPAGATAGQCFYATQAGDINVEDGMAEAFEAGDRIEALVAGAGANLSAQWRKFTPTPLVLSDGYVLGLEESRLELYGGTIGLLITGSSERCEYDVSGRRLHQIVREQRSQNGAQSNNRIYIRGVHFGAAYANYGSCANDVFLNTQGGFDNYHMPIVLIRAARVTKLRGVIRIPGVSAVVVDQPRGGPTAAGVVFDLMILHCEATNGCVRILDTDFVDGSIQTLRSSSGVVIEACAQGKLDVHHDGLITGAGLTLGAASKEARGLLVRLTMGDHAGATHAIRAVNCINSLVQFAGDPLPVVVTTGVRLHLVLPATFVTTGTVVNPAGASCEFFGGVSDAALKAYAQSAAGMRAWRSEGNRGLAIYSSRWLMPSYVDL